MSLVKSTCARQIGPVGTMAAVQPVESARIASSHCCSLLSHHLPRSGWRADLRADSKSPVM
eukprot:scaffold153345_cov37-Tisochrysis_lutea.AAC.5